MTTDSFWWEQKSEFVCMNLLLNGWDLSAQILKSLISMQSYNVLFVSLGKEMKTEYTANLLILFLYPINMWL